ncbi:NAD(P)(+) transhydrogenase (Re/Si-specific) subunit beta, partial [Ligilactobacillus ceti]
MSDTLYFLLSGGCTLLVLFGINRMSKVKQAVLGNRISGIAVALAMVLTAYRYQIFSAWTLYIVMIIALGLGFVASRKIAMIDMPQTVAVLNGFGGLASLLVAYATALVSGNDPFALITSNIAIAVGALTLTGSLIAGGKLARILNAQPQSLKFHSLWQGLLLIAMIYFIAIAQNPLITLILALVWGIIFVMRVGGADMPITISLLNSFSGVAGGIAGMAVNEPLLVAIGGIVGASGLILTQDMCKAMNRSLISILTGKTTAKPEKAAAPVQKETADQLVVEKEIELDPFEQADQVLRNAKKVIIVPGYGMALSQAQQAVATLAQKLKDQGTEVKYAIHPVAGRMPGHMSVLLCEADVDYSELYMMEDINDDFKDADAV